MLTHLMYPSDVKVKTSFTLSESTRKMLKKLAEHTGMSQTLIVELAVQQMAFDHLPPPEGEADRNQEEILTRHKVVRNVLARIVENRQGAPEPEKG